METGKFQPHNYLYSMIKNLQQNPCPYSRKLRQFKYLSKKVNQVIENGRFFPETENKLNLLLVRLKRLYYQLSLAFSQVKLKYILSSAFVFLGVGFSHQAKAQNFSNPVTNPFGIILQSVGYFSTPTFTDIDNDGDFDLFVGEYYGSILFFENTGTNSAPAFANPQTNPFGVTPVVILPFPTFADIDNDGDFDLFVGEGYGDIRFYENTGTNSAPVFANPQPNPFGITATYNAAPAFADIDNDGDLDLFVGEFLGNIQFFENKGTSSVPAFAAPQQNPFGITSTYAHAAPAFADIDNDGDFDLFVGEHYDTIQFFENTGTNSAPAFANPQTNPFGFNPVNRPFPTFADIDNDGDFDLFVGGYFGNIQYFEFNSPTGLEDQLLSKQVTLYPNPTKTTLELLIYNEYIGKVNIWVMDLHGRVIITNEAFKSGEELKHVIDLSGKPIEVYFVKVQTDQSFTTKRIIRD